MISKVPLCRYESAGGVVVSAAGQLVLVLVRAERLGPDGRPEVRLPKGHVEPGESRPQAARREVREESGLTHLEILSDLGRQSVEFNWRGARCLRDESYFLMTIPQDIEHDRAEKQFERLWLIWADALTHLTYEAEQEWVRRAWLAWDRQLQDVSDQDPEQADNHTQVEEKIAVGKHE
jgi:8-oxo-dGTP pyrophosphatase MutT (NUDIX family)